MDRSFSFAFDFRLKNAAAIFQIVLVAGFHLLPGFVMANPSGGEVVGGSASFDPSGSTLNVKQSSDRAIINWQDFSIGTGETTKFIQPSSSSAVLNRVVGNNLSSIYGNLKANGQVYLINPNGIVVGSTGVINAGGFVASTGDVADGEFLAGGDLNFKISNQHSQIRNLGKISVDGGDLFLIAREVDNQGELKAPQGKVGLAGGTEVLVKTSGEERIFIEPSSPAASVNNAGLIEAASAELKAAGGNEYALAINNSGVIRATGVENRGGKIWLVSKQGAISHTGTLQARKSDGGGGFIETSGMQVNLPGTIDAGQGGTWLIDPYNIEIVSGSGVTNNSGSSAFTPSGDNSLIGVDLIISQLNSGTNVIIDTGGTGSPGTQVGNITVNAAILKTTANSSNLTFLAAGGLVINNTINLSVGGSVLATVQGGIVANANVTAANAITWTATGNAAGNYHGIVLNGIQVGADTLSFTGTGHVDAPTPDFFGVYLNSGANVSGTTVSFNGTGANATNGGNGIRVDNSSVSTSGGVLNLTGTARGTGNFNYGIYALNNAQISASSGSMVLNGTGSQNAAGADNYGIHLSGGSDLTAANDTSVELTGFGGTGSNGNNGIRITDAGTTITTVNGNLIFGGTGRGLGNDNYGVFITSNADVSSSGNGNISITGNGSSGAGVTASNQANRGIMISVNGKVRATGSGGITLIGTGGAGSGNFNQGVFLGGATALISANGGAVSITGTGGSVTGSTADENYGVVVQNGADITNAVSGTIRLDGRAGAGDTANYGVLLRTAGTTISTVNGSLTIVGRGAGTGADNRGISVESTSLITSSGGLITLTGTGSLTGNASNAQYGILVETGADVTATGTAAILLDGTGGAGLDFNYGVIVRGSGTTLSAANGALRVEGTGGGTGSGNRGISLEDSAQLLSGSGLITVDGTGSAAAAGTGAIGVFIDTGAQILGTGTAGISLLGEGGTGSNGSHGIYLKDAANLVQTQNGAIILNGQGGGQTVSSGNYGVLISNGDLQSIGTGFLSITGTGGLGANSNIGIEVGGVGARVGTNSGTLTFDGTGGGTTQFNYGVLVTISSLVESFSGPLSVTGEGGGEGDLNYGVAIGLNGLVHSGGGNITIDGTGTQSGVGSDNYGIFFVSGGRLQADGSANAMLTGLGGTGNNFNRGIRLVDAGTEIQMGTGTLTLHGTGLGTGSLAYGVVLNTGAEINSGGNISVTGVAGGSAVGDLNVGVNVEGASSINTVGTASLDISGTGGPGTNADGIRLQSAGTALTAGDGNVTLTADKMQFGAGTSVQGTGDLLIQTLGTSTSVGLGGGSGTLNLAAAELGALQDGFSSIIIGRSDSTGAVTVGSYVFKDNTVMRSPLGAGSITVSGTLETSFSQSLQLIAGGDISIATGGSLIPRGDLTLVVDNANGARAAQGNGTFTNNGTIISLFGDEIEIYSVNPGQTTLGTITAVGFTGKRYDVWYGEAAAVTNGVNYKFRPTLSLTANSFTVFPGDPLPTLGYSVSGLQTGDVLLDVITGLPVLSTAAMMGSLPGDYTVSIAAAATALGYELVLVDGTLTIGLNALQSSLLSSLLGGLDQDHENARRAMTMEAGGGGGYSYAAPGPKQPGALVHLSSAEVK